MYKMNFYNDIYAVVAFFPVLACNILGNSLVIYFISKKQRTLTDYLLLNLAISDMMYAIFETPKFLPRLIQDVESVESNRVLCKIFLRGNISVTAKYVCIGTMMTLSLERYVAICRPHSFKRWFSPRKIKIIVVMLWLASIVYSLPLYLSNRDKCDISTSAARVISTVSITIAGFDLLFLSFLSTKIYIALWLKQTAIHPTQLREIEERKRKKKVTLCVLAVIVSFLVAFVPYFVVDVVVTYNHGKGVDHKKLAPYQGISTVLLTINTALDPYLYSFQNSRFRSILRKIVLCRCGQQELPAQQSGL